MAVMTSIKLAAQIRSISTNSIAYKQQVQEALISCAYYAAKDGQVTPFNDLLDAVGSSTRIAGIVLWVNKFGFARIKGEKFVTNASMRKESNVTDEASFASCEASMRAAPLWCDLAPKEPKNPKPFDEVEYLQHVIEKLNKEGKAYANEFLTNALVEVKKAKAVKAREIADLGEALL